MMTNPLLEAKYQVQKRLDEEARHDITEYAKNSHRIVSEIEAAYGIKFKYNEKANISAEEKHLLSKAVKELVEFWRKRNGQGIH
jgi:hypothetical protein